MLIITRKQIHKIIDQLPDSALNDVKAMLQDYIEYNTAIPRKDGLPIYDMANPEHIKIILNRHTSKPSLKAVKEVNQHDQKTI